MQKFDKEVLESCKENILKVIKEVGIAGDYLQNGQEQQGIELVPHIIHSLKQIIYAVVSIQKYSLANDIKFQDITNQLSQLVEALEASNYKLVADLFTCKIRPTLEQWLQSIKINNVIGLIFSKDRAMQLDATLRSMYLHCQDMQYIKIKVIYVTSDSFHEEQYQQLMNDYTFVEFIKEDSFKGQILSNIEKYAYVLFLVDDNIFVQDFSIKKIVDCLKNNNDTLGFSLRLGINTNYCYPLDCVQKTPDFSKLDNSFLKYIWTVAQHDFGYPLEVSSSVYRVSDMLPLLMQIQFSNPNTLEIQMNVNKGRYINNKEYIICNKNSITFCCPINVVQNIVNNRAGEKITYSIGKLGWMFEKGYRVDVEKYSGFLPNSCHQEVELVFSNKKIIDSKYNEQIAGKFCPQNQDIIEFLFHRGLIDTKDNIRLHLGCGGTYLSGYVNIDYPPSEHNLMNVVADLFADINEINFPERSIDEIRLHHVFEHFNRVTALALLIRWHSWLKIGGVIRIETPDILGSAQTLLSDTSFKVKMGVVRHLAGDQAASWAYHIDHWWPERFVQTLTSLGFEIVETRSFSWSQEPYLSNVEVIAQKSNHVSMQKQLKAAEELLWYSTVSTVEKPMHDIWKEQLRTMLKQ